MIPKVADIKAAVCETFDISPIDLASHRRYRHVARPRQVAMYLAHELTLMSLPEIGRQLDRDHTTVRHGIRVIEQLIVDDPKLAAAVTALRERWEDDT